MEHIKIMSIEYEYSMCDVVKVKVIFDFGTIRNCEIDFIVSDTNEITDKKIKQFILKGMNQLLERKFIDEI